uniref:Pentatricopeptide repeat-containing protein At2g37310 n=1 Tax=Elaeis guineensis var. tenera TaxID=51953 RepID=A0A6I9SDS8_ELAGV|nr:pentatricopeptide repeat-containing protein At2g37310 [Elaeis guineensis]
MRLSAPLQQNPALRRALAAVASSPAPDYRAYGLLIQHCADHGLFRQGRQLHARLLLLSVLPDNFLASKLLSLYSRSARLPEARRLFDAIPHKNLFSWNAMLLAYALHGYPFDAIRLFASLPSSLAPDAFTLSALLKSLSSLPTSSLPRLTGIEVHAFALRAGLDADLFVSNGLITLYARTDDLTSARKLFDAMPQRDIISWNSMISGYSQGGNYEACLGLYQEMERGQDGVVPNRVTVVSVLHACAELKDLTFGIRVHRMAVENGIEMDTVLWNSIIGLYAKCGSLDYARRLFEEMAEKDGISYSVMIAGYMSYGFVDQAMELFRQMVNPVLSTWNAVISGLFQNNRHNDVLDLFHEMQASGFRPNSVTLSSVLPSLSFFSNLLGGKQVHGYCIRNECDQNIYVATALIDLYAKAGFLDGAQRLFEGTKLRSVIVWTAIISAHASHGGADASLALFERMLDAGIKPDPVTFTAVLSACAHAGVVDKARHIFDAMLPEHGISPAVEHYACMVGVLGRNGMLKEAVEFIDKMPFESNAKVWGPLLNGAAMFGDVELGQLVFDRLFEIEPENTGNYIVMANLYSKAGKWEEANMVRDKMRGTGLAKIPGCSWMEISNGLQVFVAGDTSNRRSEEIYVVLEGLVRLMREEGYVLSCELDEESDC